VEIADASGEEYDRVCSINLRGVWNCMKYELVKMRKQGSGAIVNCSSIGGLIGLPGCAIYHATKVLWLCSPQASFIIGHALAVDGGFTAHWRKSREGD